jgi:hypothetical protein
MNLVVCAVMNVDPNGPHAYRHFRSSGLVLTDEPLPNGLHYKPNIMFGMGEVDHFYKRRLNSDVRAILSRMRAGSKHKRYTTIPSMDLYNEKTWSFDLRQIGFEFPKFATNHNPFDLTKPRATNYPQKYKEIEDYAAEGRIIDWYRDLPARRERQAQFAHPLFRT